MELPTRHGALRVIAYKRDQLELYQFLTFRREDGQVDEPDSYTETRGLVSPHC